MKRFVNYILLLIAVCLSSCIDEYEINKSEEMNERNLVVEGSICSDALCVFRISQTMPLFVDGENEPYFRVTDADVYVRGTDGLSLYATADYAGAYYIYVTPLNPEEKYWLEIYCDNDFYQSEPMQPLFAPELEEVSFAKNRDDKTVDICVTTSDPQEQVYLFWDYDEYWEVNAPVKSSWAYNVETANIERITEYKNRGWSCQLQHPSIVATNDNFGNAAFSNYTLYSLPIEEGYRFQTCYYTHVKQYAITKEEYEYHKALNSQSYEMGGLFTPMPAELPTNITSDSGKKCIGYVGVRGNMSERDIYITKNDVGYSVYRRVITPSSLEIDGCSWGRIYSMGYRVRDYNPALYDVKWVMRWCVDVTDPSWGDVSLERPWFWEYD